MPLSEFHQYRDESAAARRRLHQHAYLEACERYERLRRRSGLRRLWAALTGAPWALCRLDDLDGLARSGARRLPDVQQVPLARIVGTDNRSYDFDSGFAPLHDHLRERWLGVALVRSQGRALPPIELLLVGDDYYVVDGHHRVSVARAYGEHTIAANVLVHAHDGLRPSDCAAPVLA